MQPARKVTIGCTALENTSKKGILKPDEAGYYKVPLGAFNVVNSAGMFYDAPSAVSFFEEGSVLMRKLRKGVLRGEYNHPKKESGQDMAGYLARIRTVDPDRVAFHIRNLELDPGAKDEKGNPIVMVIGEIKPCGPYGEYVRKSLDNEHENTHFSLRALTADDVSAGIKYTRDIVTWDFVEEGGISIAHKYNSPALEHYQAVSLEDYELQPVDLWTAQNDAERGDLGLEDHQLIDDLKALEERLGWSREGSGHKSPSYLKW